MSLPVLLEDLGWTSDRAEAFAAHAAAGLTAGRVALEHNHVFRVLTAGGERLAETAGSMKHRAEGRRELPVVGDWVALRTGTGGDRDQIRHVLPRRTWLSRKVAGRETEEQVVAANVDVICVVFGLDRPVNQRSIERYLVVARRSGADPVVVLNKADVAANVNQFRAEAQAAAGEVPVILTSTQGPPGLTGLEPYLTPGRTLALIGPSGVGKSSIVNRLVHHELLPTGEVRDWDGRGRHTSVHRQLVVRAQGGLIIDTPGMRELQLWDSGGLGETFDDVAALAVSCRFRDCRHEREPGCAVLAAVESGTLDARRHASYLKLQAEQREIERKREERTQQDAKRSAKIQSRALRAFQKGRRNDE